MRGFFVVRTVAAALAGVAVAAFAGTGSALATTPAPVTIEVQTSAATGTGTFTTSGAGLCPSGTTSDQVRGTPPQPKTHANFHDLKTFTCADGSGTFTANVQAHLRFDSPTDSFTWNILRGTGAYTKLHGLGSGVGEELETGINDHFTGAVHFD
jgi:hypothetical protein